MSKNFKLTADDIKPLATGLGGCIATDRITVEGLRVGFMFRQPPDNERDSGWRFMSGTESAEYMDNPDMHGVYDVNVIANYDPTVVALLESPVGSVFERKPDAADFVPVTDWTPEEEG